MTKFVKSVFILAMGIGIAGATASAEAKKMEGKWQRGGPVALEVLEGNKVNFCMRGKCDVVAYAGDEGKQITFENHGAKFTFTKTDSGYDGKFIVTQAGKANLTAQGSNKNTFAGTFPRARGGKSILKLLGGDKVSFCLIPKRCSDFKITGDTNKEFSLMHRGAKYSFTKIPGGYTSAFHRTFSSTGKVQ